MRRLLVLGFLGLAGILLPSSALAKSHLWRFDEVFSNADGSIQFIEMFVSDPNGTHETFIAGKLLESDTQTYVFPNDLPNENTFQTWILIATPSFATLPGAPTPDFVIPANFFDPTGDELRYRTSIDLLTIPDDGSFPTDGTLGYLRDGTIAANSPTNFAGQSASVDARPCVDGLDNDGDGYVDLGEDPACRDADWPREDAQCQDGLDNDGQTGTDFDGGASILGAAGVDPDGADPSCLGAPWRNSEVPARACGLGPEAAALLAAAAALGRRRAVADRLRRHRAVAG
jgi:hypothetical protein